MGTSSDSILRRIRAKKRGWVFTPKDFIDIAPRNIIDVTLHRLVTKEIIRKLDWGIYDFPIVHPKLGPLSPDPNAIKKALVRKTGDTIRPSGAMAANQLGIDTQVPANEMSVTSGASMVLKIDNQPIRLRHSKYVGKTQFSPNVANAVNAMIHLGKDNITPTVFKKLNRILSQKEKRELLQNIVRLPDWMAPIILKLAGK